MDRKYKQKTSLKSYKTEIEIHFYPAFSESCFKQVALSENFSLVHTNVRRIACLFFNNGK